MIKGGVSEPPSGDNRSAVLASLSQISENNSDFIGGLVDKGMPPLLPLASERRNLKKDKDSFVKNNSKDDTSFAGSNSIKEQKVLNARKKISSITLDEAVAVAVLSHPSMGAQAAKYQAANADLSVAESARKPQMDIFIGTGHGVNGVYSNFPTQFDNQKIYGSGRSDAGINFKQLVYDFGAAKAEINRAGTLVDIERLKLADQAEELSLRTIASFFNLLEQQELIVEIDNTVAQQRNLAKLVQLSLDGGNSTKADIDRIGSKIIETEALRSDIKTAYRVALDEFNRLTNLEPKRVHTPKRVNKIIPNTVDEAISTAYKSNPSLLSLASTGQAIGYQIDGLEAQRMPKIDLQSDTTDKHNVGAHKLSQGLFDSKTMIMASFKLMDGGMLEAQSDKAKANYQANQFKTLDEQETTELNLRRLYLTIESSRFKRDAAQRGLTTAKSVNELYTEQFKAGKRTVFEVLDSYTMLFSMQKNRINGQYEELRAIYGVLRNMGRLCEVVAHQKF